MLKKFDINSLYICPPHLYTVATLPWEIQKSNFQQYYLCILQIICIISEEKKLLLPYPPHLKFSLDLTRKKSSKSVNFWHSYLKNKMVDIFWDTVYIM